MTEEEFNIIYSKDIQEWINVTRAEFMDNHTAYIKGVVSTLLYLGCDKEYCDYIEQFLYDYWHLIN